MGKIAIIAVAVSLLAALPLLYLTGLIISSVSKGYSWNEMDWDGDGHTSISEFLLAGDTGTRPVTVNGTVCTEIYQYKDGLQLNTLCP